MRQTLKMIKEKIPKLQIHEVPSLTKCFDWTVPYEWNINDAFIMDEKGEKVVNFKENNLHVVGYSIPVNIKLPLSKLKKIFTVSPTSLTLFLTSLPITKKIGDFVLPMKNY